MPFDAASLCEQAWNIVIPSIEHALDAGVLAGPFEGTLVVLENETEEVLFQERFNDVATTASYYDAVALRDVHRRPVAHDCDYCPTPPSIAGFVTVAFSSSAPEAFNEAITESVRWWIRALDESRN